MKKLDLDSLLGKKKEENISNENISNEEGLEQEEKETSLFDKLQDRVKTAFEANKDVVDELMSRAKKAVDKDTIHDIQEKAKKGLGFFKKTPEPEPEKKSDKGLTIFVSIFFLVVVIGGFGYAWYAENNPKPEEPISQIAAMVDEGGDVEEVEPTLIAEATNTPTAKPTDTPKPTSTPSPTPKVIISVENNGDFAEMLKKKSESDPSYTLFASANRGKEIMFDGSIDYIANHGNYKTRYDILLSAWDYPGPDSKSPGPIFRFKDVGMNQLKSKTDLRVGDNVRIHAEIIEFEQRSLLFELRPVSVEKRK